MSKKKPSKKKIALKERKMMIEHMKTQIQNAQDHLRNVAARSNIR